MRFSPYQQLLFVCSYHLHSRQHCLYYASFWDTQWQIDWSSPKVLLLRYRLLLPFFTLLFLLAAQFTDLTKKMTWKRTSVIRRDCEWLAHRNVMVQCGFICNTWHYLYMQSCQNTCSHAKIHAVMPKDWQSCQLVEWAWRIWHGCLYECRITLLLLIMSSLFLYRFQFFQQMLYSTSIATSSSCSRHSCRLTQQTPLIAVLYQNPLVKTTTLTQHQDWLLHP